MQRQELVKVFKDTQLLSRKTTSGCYKQSTKWSMEDDLPPYEHLMKETELYALDDSSVEVVNADTLTTTLGLIAEGFHPLVLNMASDYVAGGGVAKGSRAQEEELFRRTNYDQCSNKKLYPIADKEFIVTEGVSIIKDENYDVLHEYDTADFIAVAAVRKPRSNGTEYSNDEEREIMKVKIDAIFRYAVYQEADSLVLGALGCGAFYNPPKAVCALFKESLERYGKYFQKIVFAVLSEGNNRNYDVFKSLATAG
jgi:uncharacterized protein (TIGR02452 family)